MRSISPTWDPWDAWYTIKEKGHYELTSVEFTVTNLCNLRCQHCAVGELLVEKEGIPIPVEQLIQRLEEIPTLKTISMTGGEPVFHPKIVHDTIQPLLQYAKNRGIYTQLNTNLTLPFSRYQGWIEDVDVVHISYNYRNAEDFRDITFRNMNRTVNTKVAENLYETMKENAKKLSDMGVFVSAESLLSPFTAQYITQMHQDIVEMGCARHEVHPLYASDFAKNMDLIDLDTYKKTIRRLLDEKESDIWILFGTLPIYPCSDNEEDTQLWRRLFVEEESVTVRQDPDGRNRLNVNAFTGDVIVTDFGDVPPLGNIHKESLPAIFERWLSSTIAKQAHCFCEQAQCTGPNLLVADSYYSDWDFQERKAKITIR